LADRPDFNLRIDEPEDRKKGAWDKVYSKKVVLNKAELDGVMRPGSRKTKKREFDASYKPQERKHGVWRPLQMKHERVV
jgi:hypothetical protein